MNIVICAREINRHIEGKCTRRFRGGNIGIYNSERVLGRPKERIWQKRWQNSKDSGIDEVKISKQDNERICTEV